MAGSPKWKVYRGREYIAACKYPSDAAALAAVCGDETMVRYEHGLLVWWEGHEAQSAGQSYDHAAGVMVERVNDAIRAARARREASKGGAP